MLGRYPYMHYFIFILLLFLDISLNFEYICILIFHYIFFGQLELKINFLKYQNLFELTFPNICFTIIRINNKTHNHMLKK